MATQKQLPHNEIQKIWMRMRQTCVRHVCASVDFECEPVNHEEKVAI